MKRNTSADSLRGLAIVLVVLRHSIVSVAWVYHAGPGLTMLSDGHWVSDAIAFNPLLNIVYAFHMPLFAFVSGLVSWRPKLSPALGQIRSRFLGLMVPYFAWVVVYYVLSVRPIVLSGLVGGLRTAATNPWGGLWYLYALFECYLLLILIQRLPYSRWILAATAVYAVALSASPLGGSHFMGVGDVTYIYPFFVGGYLLAEKNDAVKSRRYLIAGLALRRSRCSSWHGDRSGVRTRAGSRTRRRRQPRSCTARGTSGVLTRSPTSLAPCSSATRLPSPPSSRSRRSTAAGADASWTGRPG